MAVDAVAVEEHMAVEAVAVEDVLIVISEYLPVIVFFYLFIDCLLLYFVIVNSK